MAERFDLYNTIAVVALFRLPEGPVDVEGTLE
jgi:hypothetical protein